LNACINCAFENVRTTAIDMVNNISMLVANSDFILPAGATAIRNNLPVGIVSSRFVVRGDDTPVLASDIICEGCVFAGPAHGSVPLAESGRRIVVMQSTARHLDPATGATVVAAESSFDAEHGQFRVGMWSPNGQRSLLDGSPQPVPSLLVDWIDR
jgi:hypothetical protein